MACIDVGCARYGGDYSIERLAQEFQPDFIYGFDPASDYEPRFSLDKTEVRVSKAAAWVHDGETGFKVAGLGGHVDSRSPSLVECVDLAGVIVDVYEKHGPGLVLKVDAEGAEYYLLEHLIAQGADELLELAWVEWHPGTIKDGVGRRMGIEASIGCALTEWRW